MNDQVPEAAVLEKSEPPLTAFTLFWLHGIKQKVTGLDIADACNRAGIGRGAIPALDFYQESRFEHKWEWSTGDKRWQYLGGFDGDS